MLLPLSLEAVNTTVSTGADAKANTMGAPQRGHRALLEPLTQFGDALSSVDASLAILAEAADGVLVETVTGRRSWEGEECQRALTGNQTLGSRFERRVAYSSDCSVELPLMPSARAAPPSGPRSFCWRLRARERRLVLSTVVSTGADTKANTLGPRRT